MLMIAQRRGDRWSGLLTLADRPFWGWLHFPLIVWRGEQSCTEVSLRTCHLHQAGKAIERRMGSQMARTFDELRNGVRRWVVRFGASMRRRFTLQPRQQRAWASPRMCPFCGLLTPKANSSCLECGKSFAPAK